MKSNIKSKKGFTIIELLVVIVVIGILAAISVVSYTGVSNKAQTAKGLSNADSVKTIVEAYYNDENKAAWPATASDVSGYTGGVVKIPSGISVQDGTTALTAGLAKSGTVLYKKGTGGNGACIAYWDFASSDIVFVYAGSAVGTKGTGTSIGVITACV